MCVCVLSLLLTFTFPGAKITAFKDLGKSGVELVKKCGFLDHEMGEINPDFPEAWEKECPTHN